MRSRFDADRAFSKLWHRPRAGILALAERALRLAVAGTVCCAVLTPFTAYARDTIIWHRYEFVPNMILQGPYTDQGVSDMHLQFLHRHLPQYTHTFETLTPPRLLADAQAGKPVCSTMLIKTPNRESAMQFSEPYFYALPLSMVVLKSRMAELKPFVQADGSVSLHQIVQNSNWRFGVTTGRAFGAALDSELTTLRQQHPHRIIERSSTDLLQGVLSMLAAQRIDFTLAYANEVHFIATTQKRPSPFAVLPIHEAPDLIPVGVACARTAFGQRTLKAIHQVMQQHNGREVFRRAYERWLDTHSLTVYRRQLTGIKP